jgi:hypothetical protein
MKCGLNYKNGLCRRATNIGMKMNYSKHTCAAAGGIPPNRQAANRRPPAVGGREFFWESAAENFSGGLAAGGWRPGFGLAAWRSAVGGQEFLWRLGGRRLAVKHFCMAWRLASKDFLAVAFLKPEYASLLAHFCILEWDLNSIFE